MKSKEAPEKIYIIKHSDYSDRYLLNAFTEKETNNDIEYTRTDIFIEKAKKYFTEKFSKDVSILTGGVVSVNFDAAISNFIEYMKGE